MISSFSLEFSVYVADNVYGHVGRKCINVSITYSVSIAPICVNLNNAYQGPFTWGDNFDYLFSKRTIIFWLFARFETSLIILHRHQISGNETSNGYVTFQMAIMFRTAFPILKVLVLEDFSVANSYIFVLIKQEPKGSQRKVDKARIARKR